MKNPSVKNIPSSVHGRLLALAQKRGRPFNELLQYYPIERFLCRLSQSKYAQKFVLKGALLFQARGLAQHRPTREIDLLGYTANEVEGLVQIVRNICTLEVEPDGLVFDSDSVRGERITEDADYQGVRVRVQAGLGNARLYLQIDVGFADVISPTPTSLNYPTLLSMPAPRLRGYPPDTVVAEKLQATAFLGIINSRMKDFYDLWVLASRFSFKGPSLQKAVSLTFENRGTPISAEIPALKEPFALEKQAQWQAFLSRNALKDAPRKLVEATYFLHEFLAPVLADTEGNQSLMATWKAGGPWRRVPVRR